MLPRVTGRLREWAYAGLTFNLVFATFSHIVVDKNIAYILTPVVVMVILALSYTSWHKLQAAKERREDGAYLRSMA